MGAVRRGRVARAALGVFWALGVIALGGCSKGTWPTSRVTCLASPAISGELRPRWDRLVGIGAAGTMRLRSDGNLVLSGRSNERLLGGGPDPVPFIAAMNRDGEILWHRSFDAFYPVALAVDADNNTYVVGPGGGGGPPVDLGRGPIHASTILAKLDRGGHTVFAVSLDNTIPFAGALPGQNYLQTTAVAIAGAAPAQVAVAGKLSGRGVVAWYDAATGSYLDSRVGGTGVWPHALAAADAGSLIVAGKLGDFALGEIQTLDWGPSPVSAASSGFVAAFDHERNGLWARALGEQSDVTALTTDGSRAFIAGTFRDWLAVDGAMMEASGSKDIMVLAVDDVASRSARLTARTLVPALEGDQFDALVPDGAGGVIAFGETLHPLKLGDLVVPPLVAMIVGLDSAGGASAHAFLPSSSWNVKGASVVHDAHGTFLFGSFGEAINLGGSRFRAIDENATMPGLFAAAFGPESASRPSVACPDTPELLTDLGFTGSFTHIVLAGDTVIGATQSTLTAVPPGGPPRSLAVGQEHISAIAVAGDRVFWTGYGPLSPDGVSAGQGVVATVPLAGGTPTVLASEQMYPDWVASDGTTVYWVAGGERRDGTSVELTGALYAVPAAGGPSTLLAGGFSWTGPVLARSGSVVFAGGAASDKGEIFRIATAGTPAEAIGVTEQRGASLAMDDDDVYWTAPGGIRKAPLAGGETTLIPLGSIVPRDLALVDGRLYWLVGSPSAWPDPRPELTPRIQGISADGTGAVVDHEIGEGIGAFAVDRQRMVWAAVASTRPVLRARPLTGTP